MTPEAVILFSGTHQVGVNSGELNYRGRWLMALQRGKSRGYGSRWWGSGDANAAQGAVLVFAGDQAPCAGPLASGRGSQLQKRGGF